MHMCSQRDACCNWVLRHDEIDGECTVQIDIHVPDAHVYSSVFIEFELEETKQAPVRSSTAKRCMLNALVSALQLFYGDGMVEASVSDRITLRVSIECLTSAKGCSFCLRDCDHIYLSYATRRMSIHHWCVKFGNRELKLDDFFGENNSMHMRVVCASNAGDGEDIVCCVVSRPACNRTWTPLPHLT